MGERAMPIPGPGLSLPDAAPSSLPGASVDPASCRSPRLAALPTLEAQHVAAIKPNLNVRAKVFVPSSHGSTGSSADLASLVDFTPGPSRFGGKGSEAPEDSCGELAEGLVHKHASHLRCMHVRLCLQQLPNQQMILLSCLLVVSWSSGHVEGRIGVAAL